MFARLRRNYRRLTQRVLWVSCCVACVLCLTFVFLSLYYLEDHRDRFVCQRSSKERLGSPEAVLNPCPAGLVSKEYLGSIQDLLAENIELKRNVKSLANLRSENHGDLVNLQQRRLDYIQRIKAENNELKRTIQELGSFKSIPRESGFARLRWKERSLLKYFTGEASRQYVNEIFPRETEGFLREDVLNCKEISRIVIEDELGRGYTKLTQRGVYNGREVAVKSVGLDSTDLQNCMQKKRVKISSDCLLFSRYKVMKELLLYQQLSHPNVVKLLGYCFQNDQDTTDIQSRGLTVVTELGSPLNLMTILQMAWHQRFRIAVGLAKLMKYFSASPLGSLVIRDFQLIQFVLVNGEVRLSDLDDVGNEEHSCHVSQDCVIGNHTYNITLPCVHNLCQGYNERWNLYSLQRFYFKMFLLPGSPEHVARDLQRIENEAALLKYSSGRLVRDLEKVLAKLRNGQGLEKGKYNARYQYKAMPHADFPGNHDYECEHSISLVNCQSLAFDEVEAMRQCDDDEQCQAFVMSYDKTWIGYKWVYFKNNSTGMVFSANNMVYVKVA